MSAIPPLLFEALNCLLWTTGLFLELIFLWYLVTNFRHLTVRMSDLISLRKLWMAFSILRMRDQAVIAMAVMTFGEVVTRWWTWYARFSAASGSDTHWAYNLPWVAIPIIGAAIETTGRCCLIRVFTPDDWGNKAWLICIAMSLVVTILTGIH